MQFNHGWTRMDTDLATAKYTNHRNAFNAKTQRGSSRNQRSADSFVRAKAPMRPKQADKAVLAPEKSSRRTMIPRDCSAKVRRRKDFFSSRRSGRRRKPLMNAD